MASVRVAVWPLALGVLTACAAAPRAAPDVAPAPAAASPAADGARPGHTEADARFVQQMIAHHAQALTMTALVPERSASADIRLMAERIEVSQRSEIALMRNWLRTRGRETPDSAADHDHRGAGGDHAVMPGMLTAAEMSRLAGARGTAFDRLFLEYMIRHHEGALAMVAALFATPGAGEEPEIFRLASDVDADQRAEIRRMRAMLDALPPAAPR